MRGSQDERIGSSFNKCMLRVAGHGSDHWITGSEMNQPPFVPLDHQVRRCVLRELHRDFAQHSIDELAHKLRLDASAIRYHVEVLAKWRTVRQVKGPDGGLLESLVAEDPEVTALLISTRAEDESH